MRFDVAESAMRHAESTGDWSGIAFPAAEMVELIEAAERVVAAADRARERGQTIQPRGVWVAIGLLRAVLAGVPGGDAPDVEETR